MNYSEVYKALGVTPAKMPGDYTPDKFAKWLMRDVPKQGNVKASIHTTPVKSPNIR